MIEAQEFTGWVEKIYEPTEYGQEFTVRDYKDKMEAPKFPQCLKFNASNKCKSQLMGVVEGDKIKVRFYLHGVSGEGRNGYYCIVKLNVAKDGGITIVEKAPVIPEVDVEHGPAADEELPF